MEFKYEKYPPDASDYENRALYEAALDGAMDQINDRGYCDKYIGDDKAIYKATFAFPGRDEIEMRVL